MRLKPFSIVEGLWACAFNLGNFVGPTLGGFLVDAWGFRRATDFFLGVFLVMVACDAANLASAACKGIFATKVGGYTAVKTVK